ncbi:MAG: OmpA family protein [Bacteroidota bacterium]|nr:OmpA family protein [Bacteroidota bacterium]
MALHSPGKQNRSGVRLSHVILSVAVLLWLHPPECSAQAERTGTIRFVVEPAVGIPGDEFTRLQTGYTYNPFLTGSAEYYLRDELGVHAALIGGILHNSAGDLIVRKYYRLDYNTVKYTTFLAGLLAGASYSLPPLYGIRLSLLGRAGYAVYFNETQYDDRAENLNSGTLIFGPGASVEFALSKSLNVRIVYNGFFTRTDFLDGVGFGGSRNDGFSLIAVGFSWAGRRAEGKSGVRGTSPVFPTNEPSAPFPDETGENPESGDRDESAPTTPSEAHGDREMGRISSTLAVSDFENLPALRGEPEAFLLTVENRTGKEIRADVGFEISRDGRPIGRSMRKVRVPDSVREFHAHEFLDLDALAASAGSRDSMPTGIYDVEVEIRPEGGETPSRIRTALQHIDYPAVFGADAERVRYLVRTGKSRISLQRNGGILFNTFPAPNAGRESDERTEGLVDRSSREAATVLPLHLPQDRRESYIETMVRESFTRAMLITSAAQQVAGRDPVSVVVAETYFPYDEAQITEEGRRVLDGVAQLLHQHPEIKIEIRGFADEAGDDAYNVLLSQRRADRVYEYLNRRQIPDSRIYARGLGRTVQDPSTTRVADRAVNRRVQIVVGDLSP